MPVHGLLISYLHLLSNSFCSFVDMLKKICIKRQKKENSDFWMYYRI